MPHLAFEIQNPVYRAVADKKGAAGAGEPAPPPARMVLLDAVPLEAELLDHLKNDLRSYRRWGPVLHPHCSPTVSAVLYVPLDPALPCCNQLCHSEPHTRIPIATDACYARCSAGLS